MTNSTTGDPNGHLYFDLRDGNGEEAVRCLLPRIKRFVCKQRPDLSQDAEEIAVNTMERVYERLTRFDGSSRFTTWVFGVAVNVVREWLRDREKQPLQYEPDATLAAEGNNPEQIVLAEITRELNVLVINEALDTLTDLQRTVFTYCHTTKLTSAEIGERIGRSAGAVRSAHTDAEVAIEKWRKKKGYA